MRHYVSAGGLVSYGSDFASEFRSAAGFVDRILGGEKPRLTLAIQKARAERTLGVKDAERCRFRWMDRNQSGYAACRLPAACLPRSVTTS